LQIIGVKLAAHGVNLWLLWAGFAGLGLIAALISGAVSYELIEVRLRRLLDPALRGLFFGVHREAEARYVA
jgi:peptidoglycan/LPS O-acetylase OafA/YrhL